MSIEDEIDRLLEKKERLKQPIQEFKPIPESLIKKDLEPIKDTGFALEKPIVNKGVEKPTVEEKPEKPKKTKDRLFGIGLIIGFTVVFMLIGFIVSDIVVNSYEKAIDKASSDIDTMQDVHEEYVRGWNDCIERIRNYIRIYNEPTNMTET